MGREATKVSTVTKVPANAARSGEDNHQPRNCFLVAGDTNSAPKESPKQRDPSGGRHAQKHFERRCFTPEAGNKLCKFDLLPKKNEAMDFGILTTWLQA